MLMKAFKILHMHNFRDDDSKLYFIATFAQLGTKIYLVPSSHVKYILKLTKDKNSARCDFHYFQCLYQQIDCLVRIINELSTF